MTIPTNLRQIADRGADHAAAETQAALATRALTDDLAAVLSEDERRSLQAAVLTAMGVRLDGWQIIALDEHLTAAHTTPDQQALTAAREAVAAASEVVAAAREVLRVGRYHVATVDEWREQNRAWDRLSESLGLEP